MPFKFNNYLGLITVRTPRQLDALAIQTYILGVIMGVFFLLIAGTISGIIKFQGGSNPKDPGKRRLWFWIMLFTAFSAFFLYNQFFVADTIKINLQSNFVTINIMGSVIAAMVYLIVGFAVSKAFSTGKVGNWFPSKK